MIHIAIVDDNEPDRRILRDYLTEELTKRSISCQLSEYDSGEAFLAEFAPKRFEVLFLDIYMKKLGGLDVARQLYREDPDCKLIFLTVSREHVLDCFTVHATYYLVKPFEEARLNQALDFCFPQPKPSDLFVFHERNGLQLIRREEILYLHHVGRLTCLRLSDRLLESTDSFRTTAAPLEQDPRFLQCSRGVLLNLHFIQKQEGTDFIMQDGSRHPISFRRRSQILKRFQQFALESMRGSSL